jgi:hypothetical protein
LKRAQYQSQFTADHESQLLLLTCQTDMYTYQMNW